MSEIRGASVAKPDGEMIRIHLVVDGRIVEYVAARHVVAGLIASACRGAGEVASGRDGRLRRGPAIAVNAPNLMASCGPGLDTRLVASGWTRYLRLLSHFD
jgi:hypothetical protein